MEEYLVPTQYGEDEFIEKKSRFIGRVWPVETEEEASICIDMGFEFIQGYLTGRPIPAESLSADPVQPGQADKK